MRELCDASFSRASPGAFAMERSRLWLRGSETLEPGAIDGSRDGEVAALQDVDRRRIRDDRARHV